MITRRALMASMAAGVAAPVMALAMKHANTKDLKRLKVILESQDV